MTFFWNIKLNTLFSKGLLLAIEQSTGRRIEASGNQKLLDDFMEIANLRNQVSQLQAEKKGTEVMTIYAQMDSLDRVLSSNLQASGIAPTVRNIKVSEIVSALKKGEAIVDFYDYVKKNGNHYYVAFVMKHGMTHPLLIKVFEQDQLDALVQEAGNRYSSLINEEFSPKILNLIWKPLERVLNGCKTVYFVPSGILHSVAVESIQLPDGNTLGSKCNLTRLTSSPALLTMGKSRTINQFETARLYGGLQYDIDAASMAANAQKYKTFDILAMRGDINELRGDSIYHELKYSMGEVTEIADILAHNNINVTSLSGMNGTEESFLSMSGQSPDLLLMSTHGYYYSPDRVPSWSSLCGYDNPMYLTGLVLSGGNAEWIGRYIPEGVCGGLLSSSDISHIDLSNTQLVVLSACETGLGETTNEGVFGLQRAFKKAGAQTIVMSLWLVSDRFTKDFMVKFHQELANNGWDKRKAFNLAQSAIRSKAPNPEYWAGFIMVD